jgi:hypothetical protein
MTTITIERARLEELLGEYWEIAFEEWATKGWNV